MPGGRSGTRILVGLDGIFLDNIELRFREIGLQQVGQVRTVEFDGGGLIGALCLDRIGRYFALHAQAKLYEFLCPAKDFSRLCR